MLSLLKAIILQTTSVQQYLQSQCNDIINRTGSKYMQNRHFDNKAQIMCVNKWMSRAGELKFKGLIKM